MGQQEISKTEAAVREVYPQAFVQRKGRVWHVHRDPSEPFSNIWLGGGVSKRNAWEKALRNIRSGPQCCFPHPLDFVACDEDGNTLEIEICANSRVSIGVIEHSPAGEERTSQHLVTGDLNKLTAIRDAMDRVIAHIRLTTTQQQEG